MTASQREPDAPKWEITSYDYIHGSSPKGDWEPFAVTSDGIDSHTVWVRRRKR